MHYHFSKEQLNDFKANIHREWVLTNGIGGYAGSSILGAHNRTHQGYLIASLKPPVSRYLVFSKTNEVIRSNDNIYDLTTAQHFDQKLSEGQKYLTAFDYDGTVCFTYEVEGITVKKHITLVQGENQVALAYEIINNSNEATLTVTPLMNYRDHSDNVTEKQLDFNITNNENSFSLVPTIDETVSITLGFSRGKLLERENKYDVDMQLQTEVDNEVDGLDTHFMPFDIEVLIPQNKTTKFTIICSLENNNSSSFVVPKDNTGFELCKKQLKYVDSLIKTAEFEDEFAQNLTVAANQFITERSSTGYKTVLAGLPWFTDWGRDTMIAFTGLTLSTKQYKTAQDILLTFTKYVKNGMIPNMFPDDGQDPLYNTADASLWYFYAVYKYLEYTNTENDYNFVKENIFPYLKDIIDHHVKGTDFSIYMDKDYLMHAGSGIDQVTWMDVRVGDWVPTPRHGKPVEINALWYNALKVMEYLSNHYKEDASYYSQLASKVKDSFNKTFWNEDAKCLYDVIGDDEKDPTIRPNQIYAICLPFTMLPPEKEKAVVDVVQDKLYVGNGLRSLDPMHKDYHPIYLGSLAKRDAAYHQGTSWGFILGGFISAYVKVNGANKEAAQKALKLLEPIKQHMYEENCIGSICEIFDGDAPHYGRGCYAQAWSIGETLRCYAEDILPLIN